MTVVLHLWGVCAILWPLPACRNQKLACWFVKLDWCKQDLLPALTSCICTKFRTAYPHRETLWANVVCGGRVWWYARNTSGPLCSHFKHHPGIKGEQCWWPFWSAQNSIKYSSLQVYWQLGWYTCVDALAAEVWEQHSLAHCSLWLARFGCQVMQWLLSLYVGPWLT